MKTSEDDADSQTSGRMQKLTIGAPHKLVGPTVDQHGTAKVPLEASAAWPPKCPKENIDKDEMVDWCAGFKLPKRAQSRAVVVLWRCSCFALALFAAQPQLGGRALVVQFLLWLD